MAKSGIGVIIGITSTLMDSEEVQGFLKAIYDFPTIQDFPTLESLAAYVSRTYWNSID